MIEFSIKPKDHGKRILAFLKEHLDYSSKVLKNGIDSGALRINKLVERFSTATIKKGDLVTFDESKISHSQSFSLPILYQEENFLLCHKPSGLVTDAKLFKELLSPLIFLVHRLDKETSGVILIAKKKEMQKKLEILFKKREVQKTYVALVKGNLRKDEGTIENLLIKKSTYQGQSIWGSTKNSKGKRAVTHWKCLKRGKGMSLIQCHPETGRTHQLRVHLSEMGHPILGDYQYGRKVVFPQDIHRLCLHAYQIRFSHPETGKKVQVTAPLPSVFKI